MFVEVCIQDFSSQFRRSFDGILWTNQTRISSSTIGFLFQNNISLIHALAWSTSCTSLIWIYL